MEGYLTKRGSFFKTWRTRWFELSDNTLTYYKNQSKNVCKGSYILTEDTIVESFEEFQGNKFMLRLLNKERELLLSSVNEEDQTKWLNALKNEINFLRDGNTKEKGGVDGRTVQASGRFSVFGFSGLSAIPPLMESVSSNTASPPRAVQHVTNTTVYMEGFLMKRARGVLMRGLQNWKARWFVLSEEIVTNPDDNSVVSSTYKLTYYKDACNQKDAHSEEKGCFVFDKCTKIRSLPESGEFRHIIVLSRGSSNMAAQAEGLGGLGALGALGLGDDSGTAAESEEKGDGREIVLSAVDSDTENKWLDALSKVVRKAYLAENIQNTGEGSAIGLGKPHSVEAAARAKRAANASAGRGKTSRRLRVDGPAGVSNVPKVPTDLNHNRTDTSLPQANVRTTTTAGAAPSNLNEWDDDSEDDESVCGDEVETSGRNLNPSAAGTVPLPKGWVKVKNGSTVYYYHTKARVSRWDVPTPEVAAELEARLEEEEKRAMDAAKKRNEELAMKKAAKEETERLAAEMKDQIVAKCDAWRHYPGTSNIRSLPELLIDLHDLFPSIVSKEVLVPECEEEARAVKKMYMKVIRLLHPDKLSNKLDLETRLLADAVYRQLSDIYMVYRKAFAEI